MRRPTPLAPVTVAMPRWTVYQAGRQGRRIARVSHLPAESPDDACRRLRHMLGEISKLWVLEAQEER